MTNRLINQCCESHVRDVLIGVAHPQLHLHIQSHLWLFPWMQFERSSRLAEMTFKISSNEYPDWSAWHTASCFHPITSLLTGCLSPGVQHQTGWAGVCHGDAQVPASAVHHSEASSQPLPRAQHVGRGLSCLAGHVCSTPNVTLHD